MAKERFANLKVVTTTLTDFQLFPSTNKNLSLRRRVMATES